MRFEGQCIHSVILLYMRVYGHKCHRLVYLYKDGSVFHNTETISK